MTVRRFEKSGCGYGHIQMGEEFIIILIGTFNLCLCHILQSKDLQ